MSSLASSVTWADIVNFDDAKTGEAPAGWRATKTGTGAEKWTVEKDDTAPSKPKPTAVSLTRAR